MDRQTNLEQFFCKSYMEWRLWLLAFKFVIYICLVRKTYREHADHGRVDLKWEVLSDISCLHPSGKLHQKYCSRVEALGDVEFHPHTVGPLQSHVSPSKWSGAAVVSCATQTIISAVGEVMTWSYNPCSSIVTVDLIVHQASSSYLS
ncbi:hypothetical protein TNCT_313981 [Trichonephila clavata]|uniref:Uncharacterized protein n=1 Tax=Trichonephila clavata TaxID=2740835 RepID=A0A8X6FUZ8_TRICU|nr:hypothetical protein TNCT_313981 [Trichonephila clavata]